MTLKKFTVERRSGLPARVRAHGYDITEHGIINFFVEEGNRTIWVATFRGDEWIGVLDPEYVEDGKEAGNPPPDDEDDIPF